MKLQSCSWAAQGLFIKMLCYMALSSSPGKLLLSDNKPSIRTICKVLSVHHKTFDKLSNELLKAGSLKLDENGVYYCSRMLKDYVLREKRKAAGKFGGNPNLLNQKDKHEVNPLLENGTTPSSSSSSSSPSSISKIDDRYKQKLENIIQEDGSVRKKVNDFIVDLGLKSGTEDYYWIIHLVHKYPNVNPYTVISAVKTRIADAKTGIKEPLRNPMAYITSCFQNAGEQQ